LDACADIFRNSNGASIDCFASNLGISNVLYVKAYGSRLALEVAFERIWNHLWIENDSKLATLAFKSSQIVP